MFVSSLEKKERGPLDGLNLGHWISLLKERIRLKAERVYPLTPDPLYPYLNITGQCSIGGSGLDFNWTGRPKPIFDSKRARCQRIFPPLIVLLWTVSIKSKGKRKKGFYHSCDKFSPVGGCKRVRTLWKFPRPIKIKSPAIPKFHFVLLVFCTNYRLRWADEGGSVIIRWRSRRRSHQIMGQPKHLNFAHLAFLLNVVYTLLAIDHIINQMLLSSHQHGRFCFNIWSHPSQYHLLYKIIYGLKHDQNLFNLDSIFLTYTKLLFMLRN